MTRTVCMSLSPTVALTRDLIRCPSVTPADAGALDVLQGFLTAAGFSCVRKIFSEPGTPDVDNLFAKIGDGAPHLVFAGHTDVVPAGDVARWRHDPFAGEIDADRLWGRGASDMKGAIAAFAVAVRDFLREHGALSGAISFLITGDEEGPSINGTTKLLDWTRDQGERFDHCVVGEPSCVASLGDMMKIGRRGSLNGRVTIEGVQGHVAYPERADNPVPKMARLVAALSSASLRRRLGAFRRLQSRIHHDRRGQSRSECDPGARDGRLQHPLQRSVDAGAAGERNPRRCGAGCRRRGEDRLHAVQCARLSHQARQLSSRSSPKRWRRTTGRTPELSTTGGTSDARFIVRDCEVVEFGLLNESIHKIDENAALDDIDRLTNTYRRLLELYFERP